MSSETALSHSLQILHSNFYRLFIIMPQQFHVSIAKTNISIQHAKSEKVLFWKDSNFSYNTTPMPVILEPLRTKKPRLLRKSLSVHRFLCL